MAFPIVYDRVEQSFSSSSTSHLVTMPSTVVVNDTLLICASFSAFSANPFTAAGFTQVDRRSRSQGGDEVSGWIGKKLADGTEGGTTVDVVTNVAATGAVRVYRIANNIFDDIESVDTSGTTTTPDPGSLNPAGWGTEETLWIAVAMAGNDDLTFSGFPAGYGNTNSTVSGAGTDAGCGIGTAELESEVASQNPGTFTLPSTEVWVAFTLGIRPAVSQIDTQAELYCMLNFCAGGENWHVMPVPTGAVAKTIGQSIRFDEDDVMAFTKTYGAAGNRKTFTLSTGIKRTNVGVQAIPKVTEVTVFAAGADVDNVTSFRFTSSGTLQLAHWDASVVTDNIVTKGEYNDTTAWMHVVLIVDTTQATATDRVRIVVNGVDVTNTATANYPLQNADFDIMSTEQHRIGRARDGADNFDGMMADLYFVDGQAVEATDFGEFDANGTWTMKDYAGTFGTNGFHLDFFDSDDYGHDSSGNGNDWTPSGFDKTDFIRDNPQDNCCVINALQSSIGKNFLGGSLIATWGVGLGSFHGTHGASSGKWVFESVSATSTAGFAVGIANESHKADEGRALSAVNQGKHYLYDEDGTKWISGTNTAYGDSYTTSDVIRVEFDLDNKTLEFFKNDTSQGQITITETSETWLPCFSRDGQVAQSVTANFGQRDWAHNATAGFCPLTTSLMPDVTPADPTENFNAVTYTGTGAAQSITGVGHQPDLIIIKNRDQADDWKWVDGTRGVSAVLASNSATAETTDANGVTSRDADGFTLGTGANGFNDNTEDFVAYCFKELAGFFDIVSDTGTGSAQTIAHSLGVVPELIIRKNRDQADSWAVFHHHMASDPETDYLVLDTTAIPVDDSTVWNDTAPTASVFSVGTNHNVNANGEAYITYLFASVPGLCHIKSYTGTGQADGPFIYCGFRPRMAWFKKAEGTGDNWWVKDAARDIDNSVDQSLVFDSNVAESGTGRVVDFTATGVKIRDATNDLNTTDELYVMMALAEIPLGGNVSPGPAR